MVSTARQTKHVLAGSAVTALLWTAAALGTLVVQMPEVLAQTPPTNCSPTSGAAYDCVMRFEQPYSYVAGGCASTPANSDESVAYSIFTQRFSNRCNVQYSDQGWINPGPLNEGVDFNGGCTGNVTQYPQLSFGDESSNWFLSSVTYAGSLPTCTPATPVTGLFGAIKRSRSFGCPQGYSVFSQDVCGRLTTVRDYGKMLGEQCETPGNCSTSRPINIGNANKFLKEVDYRSAAAGGPEFVRYYNSLQYVTSATNQYHFPGRIAANSATGGNLARYAAYWTAPGEAGTRYPQLGLAVCRATQDARLVAA